MKVYEVRRSECILLPVSLAVHLLLVRVGFSSLPHVVMGSFTVTEKQM